MYTRMAGTSKLDRVSISPKTLEVPSDVLS